MNRVIVLCLRYRQFVVIATVLLAIASLLSIKYASVDAIPDIGENQQIVFTEWKGRSPKDIEQHVTYPLSQILQGIPGVDRVRGESAFGFSTVYVIFKDDVDFYWSRTRILEKLVSSTGLLPSDVRPSMGPDATGLGQVFWYTLENKEGAQSPKSLQELRSLQDFYVRYQLQSSPGVAEVASVGGFVKEYQVDVDPVKMMAFEVGLPQVIRSIQNSNIDVGGEVIQDGEREIVVRGIGLFDQIEDIEEVVVEMREQAPIRVKDLATVQLGPAFRRGALDKNGSEVVGGVVTMRYGENPSEVIKGIQNKIEILKGGLPDGVVLVPFYDRSELVKSTMKTVYSALTQELIITMIVVALFLLHFRSSILVSLTLPLGVGVSFIFMYLLKIDSNIMSLSGLVIAIGSMVDMGIIMTENIYSHLSEQKDLDAKKRLKVITRASKEIGPPLMTAALTTIVTFIPVFALEGAESKLFTPLAWSKTLAMSGAVLIALLVIPAFSFYLLKNNLRPLNKNKSSKKIIDIYKPILNWVLDNRIKFLMLPLILCLAGGLAFHKLGKEFMPALNEGEILYMPVTASGISITKARELLAYTDKVIGEHPLVKNVVGKLGRAESALDPAPIEMFETFIKLRPKDEWPFGKSIYDIMQELDEMLQVPGLVNSWGFPIQTRIGMISSGIKTQVAVKVLGDDIYELESYTAQIAEVLEEVEGAYAIYAEKSSGRPYIDFEVDRKNAGRFGLNVGDVNAIVETAIGGREVAQMYEGRERYPIRVRYKRELREQLEDLESILVPTPRALHVPITQLANIKITTGPDVIQSENGILRSTVQLNVRDRDVIGFVEEAKKRVEEEIKLPPGYTLEWAGQYKNQQSANRRLMLLIPLSLIINLLLIYWRFRSSTLSMLVFSSIPLAAAGGVILLWFLDVNTSVAVWVGFIALFGMAVDDGVVMLSYLQQEIPQSGIKGLSELKEAIINAGVRRIRPLLMTNTTTVLALLPVLFSTGQGSEIMLPMAIPILGGIGLSMISIFILPAVFSLIYEKKITPIS